MNKKKILSLLNNNLSNEKITEHQLDVLALDVTRVVDKQIFDKINKRKKELNINITTYQRNKIRLYMLGYPVILDSNLAFKKYIISDIELSEAYKLLQDGLDREHHIMIESLIARFKTHFLNENKNIFNLYMDYFNKIQSNKNQLSILNIDSSDLLNSNQIAEIINKQYDSLSNYHYFAIVFNDTDDKNLISWKTISETAIYMENFKLETSFSVFQKRNRIHRINELNSFIDNNELISNDSKIKEAIEEFYSGVSYGFQFTDLFVTEDGNTKILVMQKVELDETPKPCPSCFENLVRGNSYPRVLYKSFECQNPGCPSRSKIGRGKRFDLYGVKRQFMLERNNESDVIHPDIHTKFRRDIIKDSENIIESLISLYSWSDDSVLLINTDKNNIENVNRYKNRYIIKQSLPKHFDEKYNVQSLPIYYLFNTIYNNKSKKNIENKIEHKYIENNVIVNGNSSMMHSYVNDLLKGNLIGGAITSPPYFNAREYSQWDNLICYFIDMLINADEVFNVLKKDGTYIYNIGDIVGQDNIYIKSNMSKRRQMLGFYSIMIFDIVGFNVESNIIWDKGEVHSKRNSSANRFPGYLKPINSYEHNIVLKKQNTKTKHTQVRKINAVKKINSKGENLLGHTAPFPLEIAELIIPYMDSKNEYILDPFLGSGTTIMAAQENFFKGIGVEINKDYYDLAVKRAEENQHNLFTLI